MKQHRLINQDLLIKRWSSNGIREHYNYWIKAQKIDPPPKSVSFDKVKIQRRGKLN